MNDTCFMFPSTPPGHAVWVPDPSCRGTFEIVLTCLSTSFICIWSSVHRDIPLTRPYLLRSLQRDAPLVLVALFAPELLFYFALNQFLSARYLVSVSSQSGSFRVDADASKEQGEERQQCRISEGALRLNPFPSDVENGTVSSQAHEHDGSCALPSHQGSQNRVAEGATTRKNPFTLTHAFYATMGGFAFKESVNDSGNWCSIPMKLTAEGVAFLMEHEPDLIPDLPRTSIYDRTKSNSLGKALLVGQVVMYCLNCISRLGESLPLSLLEVSTLAHGLFTLSSYAMWWSKLLSIDEPTWIPTGDSDIPSRDLLELLAILQVLSSDNEKYHFLTASRSRPSSEHDIEPLPKIGLAIKGSQRYQLNVIHVCEKAKAHITFDSAPKFGDLFIGTGTKTLRRLGYVGYRAIDYAITICIPLIYGSLHFAALRSEFPTRIERELWRVASVVVMSSGAVPAIFDIIADISVHWHILHIRKTWWRFIRQFSDLVWLSVLPVIYTLCSGYLLVECILQIRHLPHDAYVVASWSNYVPHFV